jgi:hypothetical protein
MESVRRRKAVRGKEIGRGESCDRRATPTAPTCPSVLIENR